MLEDRNLTSHTYKSSSRSRSTAACRRTIAAMRAAFEQLDPAAARAEPHPIARTISSVIFLASPNSIIVLSL